MAKITTTTGSLAAILGAVLPFAEKDDDILPNLRVVEVCAGGGEITATATNRYIAGHARKSAEGTLERPVRLDRDDVALLLLALDGFHHHGRADDADGRQDYLYGSDGELLTLEANDRSEVAVSYAGRTYRVPERHTASAIPSITRIFDGLPDRTTARLSGPIAFGTPVLRALLAAADFIRKHGRGVVTRWYFDDPEKPVRVEIGDWFLAVLMPTKGNPEPLAETPNVRYGLNTEAVQTS